MKIHVESSPSSKVHAELGDKHRVMMHDSMTL